MRLRFRIRKIRYSRKSIFDETMGDENFASLQKDECVKEVNKKLLSVILENKTDERQALTKAYNQIFKPVCQ